MEDPEFLKNLENRHLDKTVLPPVPHPRSEFRKHKSEFRSAFYRSIVFHAFVIVFALLFDVLAKKMGWQEESFQERAFQEIRTAIRVDVVDLPRLTQQELKEIDLSKEVVKDPAEPEVPKESEVPPIPDSLQTEKEKVSEKEKAKEPEKEKGEKSIADKLKDLKERLKADQKRKEEIAKLLKKKSGGSDGRPELAGNIKSEGFATTGDVATQAEAYTGKVLAHIQKYWRVPGWIKVSDYRARIAVKISPTGKVIAKKLLLSSGNAEFDQLVNRAVEASNPFPAPTEGLRLQMLQEGLAFDFPK